MNIDNKLRIGDVSDNGQITIVDEDRLCYLVKSDSRGSIGLRTISKALLYEYVDYLAEHPNASPNAVRGALSGKSEIDKYEYGYSYTLTVMAKMVLDYESVQNVSIEIVGSPKGQPKIYQQIFYGAPGTGKSNTIKKFVDEQGKKCHRTTFHPDSDYSTFVGAYKPTMKSSERIYSPEELTIKLKEIKDKKLI